MAQGCTVVQKQMLPHSCLRDCICLVLKQRVWFLFSPPLPGNSRSALRLTVPFIVKLITPFPKATHIYLDH